MKPIVRKTVTIGIALFLLMQLYQPARNLSCEQMLPINFIKIYSVPKKVATILRTSCYDCHSNNTVYPWYSYIQPARMFMEGHIKEGKENLNFSEFGNYSKRRQANKLNEIIKQIKSDEMPLASYTMVHRNAILTNDKKALLIHWIERTKDSISKEN